MTLVQNVNENNIDGSDINLKITDFENALNVYQDKNGNWFYNLNLTTNIQVSESLLSIYTCLFDSHWPLISFNIYGTTRLAWLLMKLNNVKANDIFKIVETGLKIVYISNNLIHTIIDALQTYTE